MKKGITLISLAITIVILFIILSTVVVSTVTITNNSKKAAYAKDLKTIEEAVVSEYTSSGVLPVITRDPIYTADYIKANIVSDAVKFDAELTENADTTSNFYEVDLSKIGIKNSTRGNKKNDNEKDIYIVSDNLNVYYPIGLKVGSDIYFSLTSSLIKGSKISKTADVGTGTSDTVLANGIKLSKDKKIWTNEIVISMNIQKNAGDVIKYSIAGQTEITVSTDTITLNYANLTTSERTAITTGLIADKKVVVRRLNSSGTEIAQATIYIKNLDIESPTAGVVAPVLTSTIDKNTLTFSSMADTGGSGIKEIRYEYVTKLNSNTTYENAYNPQPTIDTTYLKNLGKKSSSFNKIILPKHIRTISVIWIDNAGNVGTLTNYSVPATQNTNSYVTSGLVLWLNGADFANSPQTSSWLDRSGNGNNAIPSNFAYTTSSGSDGNGGVVFDGINDNMRVLHSSSLMPTDTTISMRINAKNWDAATATALMIKRDTTSSYFLYNATGGTLTFDWPSSTERWATGYVPPTNKWISLTITRDAFKRKLYVDGVLTAETTVVGLSPTGTSDLYIGGNVYTNNYYYSGTMRNIMMYNRALTEQEIIQNYKNDMSTDYIVPEASRDSINDYIKDGLVLHLDAINNTGTGHSSTTTSWKNLSGTAQNGTLVNFNFNSVSGWGTNYLKFDGVNGDTLGDYINITNFQQTNLNPSKYTVEMVFTPYDNTAVNANTYGLIGVNGSIGVPGQQTLGLKTYSIDANTIGMETEVSDNTNYNARTKTSFTLGQKTTVQYYNNSGELGIYKNADNKQITSYTLTPVFFRDYIYIGWISATRFAKMDLYSVRIYNRVLTDQELKQNYANDVKRFGL